MPILFYDEEGNQTAEAPAVAAGAIRDITKGAFYGRFTLDEAIALETLKDTDKVLRVLDKRLNLRSHVNLDFPELGQGIAYMVQAGILTEERAAELTADGSPDEQYSGA